MLSKEQREILKNQEKNLVYMKEYYKNQAFAYLKSKVYSQMNYSVDGCVDRCKTMFEVVDEECLERCVTKKMQSAYLYIGVRIYIILYSLRQWRIK